MMYIGNENVLVKYNLFVVCSLLFVHLLKFHYFNRNSEEFNGIYVIVLITFLNKQIIYADMMTILFVIHVKKNVVYTSFGLETYVLWQFEKLRNFIEMI